MGSSATRLALVLGAVMACSSDKDAEPSTPAVVSPKAHLREIKGAVKVKRAAGDDWVNAFKDMPLFENDKVQTAPGASALVAFTGSRIITLDQESLMGIAETHPRPGQDRTDATLLQGRAAAELSDPNQSLSVATPSATVRAGREIVFQ